MVEISALDHVHLYVADPEAAAAWYCRVLGLQVLPSSKRLNGGKYMATPRGQYCATIFSGKPPSDGDHTTAFRVMGRVFMDFGEQLPHADVSGRSGELLQATDAADHDLAFSYYFQDPDGNHLELTTYDHGPVRTWLKSKGRHQA
ncbi:VOC family protein [Cognatiyoonia sp. IB215446]|uniref:VOC family protein n=1 Tax=Cognatiyoonia sp. IB215446 TaxID=3097355 RepID=UPI002A13C938|nr:VOC family protein [Cognatiyoonia sp. IB215446]MDX8348910.1 VOC family protein [Cognatiyoonia sp. IB215446]